jgi:hypothetical protein
MGESREGLSGGVYGCSWECGNGVLLNGLWGWGGGSGGVMSGNVRRSGSR